jgi:hypothetical protein
MDRRCFLLSATVVLVASVGVAAQPSGPAIANFTITPPVVRPGGVAEIHFEYRNAQGGLREAALLARPASGNLRASVCSKRPSTERSLTSRQHLRASSSQPAGTSPATAEPRTEQRTTISFRSLITRDVPVMYWGSRWRSDSENAGATSCTSPSPLAASRFCPQCCCGG